jgi:hypothetical protein
MFSIPSIGEPGAILISKFIQTYEAVHPFRRLRSRFRHAAENRRSTVALPSHDNTQVGQSPPTPPQPCRDLATNWATRGRPARYRKHGPGTIPQSVKGGGLLAMNPPSRSPPGEFVARPHNLPAVDDRTLTIRKSIQPLFSFCDGRHNSSKALKKSGLTYFAYEKNSSAILQQKSCHVRFSCAAYRSGAPFRAVMVQCQIRRARSGLNGARCAKWVHRIGSADVAERDVARTIGSHEGELGHASAPAGSEVKRKRQKKAPPSTGGALDQQQAPDFTSCPCRPYRPCRLLRPAWPALPWAARQPLPL